MATKKEIKKRQCLLYFLDYYIGEIDGIWGQGSKTAVKSFKGDFGGLPKDNTYDSSTEKALKHAVCYGMPSKASSKAESGDFWDSIKYFRKEEFACKCGCGASEMDEKLIRIADGVRAHFGKPITVSSGRRCASHNARVGGVSNSRHTRNPGKAMDFCVSGKTSAVVLAYVQKLSGIRYAYAIDGKYVHMDVE